MDRLKTLIATQRALGRDTTQGPALVPASSNFIPVGKSADLARILRLQPLDSHPLEAEFLSSLYLPGGTMRLRPLQERALIHAAQTGGLLAPLGVGSGKTLIAGLLPTVFDCQALVLTTAGMVKESSKLFAEYHKHFRMREDIVIMSYGMLSRKEQARWLDEHQPKLIIADECQALANRESVRTARFLRYVKAHPDTIFCAMSASLTRTSLLDYGHLAALALGEGSPLPLAWPELVRWAEALDVDGTRPAGALEALCEPGERPREGFRRRLVSSPGVVSSEAPSWPGRVMIQTLDIPLTPKIRESLITLETEWQDPAGELLVQATEVAATRRALRMGGFYAWDWQSTMALHARTQWEDARRAWSQALHYFLRYRRGPGLDSPALVFDAITAKHPKTKHLQPSFEAWQKVADQGPKTSWRWLCPSVAKFGAEYLQTGVVSIVWVSHPELGRAIATRAKVPYFGAGAEGIVEHKGPCVASIRAQGTGRNLQQHSKALVLGGPSQGAAWEQLIGRHARPGQTKDVVIYTLARCSDDLRDATKDAKYIQETTGQEQFLMRKGIQ